VSLNLSPLSIQPKISSPLPPISSHKLVDEPTPTSYYQESDIFEDITITLIMPDGVTFKLIVKTGETVQEIKRKLDTLHGIPYADASLYYNGKCMIDPLSLNDFPGLVCKTNVCLDVKMSPTWKSNATQPALSLDIQGMHTTTNMSRALSMDIGAEPEIAGVTSTNSLNNISFVEHSETPPPNAGIAHSPSADDFIRSSWSPTPQQQDGPPPTLPNAFSDSPNAYKMNRRKPESDKTTTIDIIDDDDPQCKEIQNE
jgi:hypothetical protein